MICNNAGERNSEVVSEREVAGAFDANTSGWVPGEGVAAVLLRPAAAAISEGDSIHGILENVFNMFSTKKIKAVTVA